MGLKDICAELHARVLKALNPDAPSFQPIPRPQSPGAVSQASTTVSPAELPDDPQIVFRSRITYVGIPPAHMDGLEKVDPWSVRKYAVHSGDDITYARPVYGVAVDMPFITNLLAQVSPAVAESILLIGIAVKARNTTIPRSQVLRDDMHLFSQLVHAHDTTSSRTGHGQLPDLPRAERDHRRPHTAPAKRHVPTRMDPDDVYPAVRRILPPLLARHLIPSKTATQIAAEIQHTGTAIPLTMTKITAAFTCMESKLREEVFLLGSAGAVRNLITCLQTLALIPRERGHPLDEVMDYFQEINQDEVANPTTKEEKRDTYNDLQYTYEMLSAIMHTNDHREKRRNFFYDPKDKRHIREGTIRPAETVYARRVDTLRCEVLTLVFRYFVIPPGAAEQEYRAEYNRGRKFYQTGNLPPRPPTASPMPHDYIAHMVRGPTHFFSQFPLL